MYGTGHYAGGYDDTKVQSSGRCDRGRCTAHYPGTPDFPKNDILKND